MSLLSKFFFSSNGLSSKCLMAEHVICEKKKEKKKKGFTLVHCIADLRERLLVFQLLSAFPQISPLRILLIVASTFFLWISRLKKWMVRLSTQGLFRLSSLLTTTFALKMYLGFDALED